MSYDGMSDFEINKAVANKCREPWLNLSRKECSDTCLHIIESNGGYGMSKHFYVDYCNNPADMWPLILSNKISVMWDWTEMGKCSAIGKTWETRQLGKYFINHEFTHTNPLRAAAIVFLKMQNAS